MVSSLKITVAGIRGIIGESLTPNVALDFAELFGTAIKGGIVVLGTETRVSTEIVKSAIVSGLLATGCTIIDIGVVATPTTQLMVRHFHADGGIMISASHNPIMWNGLKFISPEGIFLDEKQMNALFDSYAKLQTVKKNAVSIEDISQAGIVTYQNFGQLGHIEHCDTAISLHLDRILSHIDVPLIRQSKLKVVVDCCNGAGAIMNPPLFAKLGITAMFINEQPNGKFRREPEPLPANLTDLKNAVIEHKADIGFAQDADADRLAIINEKGEAIGEDNTLVLAMKYILSRHPNPKGKIVATNLSTTKAFDDVASEYQVKVVRTRIGEVNVSKALMQPDAIIGGEGNGGVIMPEIGYGRDSFAGIAIILEYLCKSGKRVSELVSEIPTYKFVKARKDLQSTEQIPAILSAVKTYYKREKIDETDGVKIIFKDKWLHVRASNTEPIIRYFAEAKTTQEAQALIDPVFNA